MFSPLVYRLTYAICRRIPHHGPGKQSQNEPGQYLQNPPVLSFFHIAAIPFSSGLMDTFHNSADIPWTVMISGNILSPQHLFLKVFFNKYTAVCNSPGTPCTVTTYMLLVFLPLKTRNNPSYRQPPTVPGSRSLMRLPVPLCIWVYLNSIVTVINKTIPD